MSAELVAILSLGLYFFLFLYSVIFHEVMATQAFLAGTQDLCTDIKQPEAWK